VPELGLSAHALAILLAEHWLIELNIVVFAHDVYSVVLQAYCGDAAKTKPPDTKKLPATIKMNIAIFDILKLIK